MAQVVKALDFEYKAIGCHIELGVVSLSPSRGRVIVGRFRHKPEVAEVFSVTHFCISSLAVST